MQLAHIKFTQTKRTRALLLFFCSGGESQSPNTFEINDNVEGRERGKVKQNRFKSQSEKSNFVENAYFFSVFFFLRIRYDPAVSGQSGH